METLLIGSVVFILVAPLCGFAVGIVSSIVISIMYSRGDSHSAADRALSSDQQIRRALSDMRGHVLLPARRGKAPPVVRTPLRLASDAHVSGRCLICGDALEGKLLQCPCCSTLHHADCWKYNGRCAVYGCDASDRDEMND
jgi:hypothetical protein